MKYIETDLCHYYECVFQNIHNMEMAVEGIVQLKEEVTLDLQGPQRDTITAINDALPILKAQTEVWVAHGRRLQQFISEELRANHSKTQWEVGSTKKNNDTKIVSVLRIMKTIAEICDETANTRSRVIRYLDQIISEKVKSEQTVMLVFEELQGSPIMDSHSSALWKQITRARILWRMYLQEYVLLEVRKQKEILHISRICRKFLFNISEEASNFYACAKEAGDFLSADTPVNRYADLFYNYKWEDKLERRKELRFLYTDDLVVDYIQKNDLTDAWEVASNLFLEELENIYDENNLRNLTDDLYKLAYVLVNSQICYDICNVLIDYTGSEMYHIYGYPRIDRHLSVAVELVLCAAELCALLPTEQENNALYKEEHEKAISDNMCSRNQLQHLFSGGQVLIDKNPENSKFDLIQSLIACGYQDFLSKYLEDATSEQERYIKSNESEKIVEELLDDAISTWKDKLLHTNIREDVRNWVGKPYMSHLERNQKPIIYFETSIRRNMVDLVFVEETLAEMAEILENHSSTAFSSVQKTALLQVGDKLRDIGNELHRCNEDLGFAIDFIEKGILEHYVSKGIKKAQRLIQCSSLFSREELSWRHGQKFSPLPLYCIGLYRGIGGTGYSISAVSQWGGIIKEYSSRHKIVSWMSASC